MIDVRPSQNYNGKNIDRRWDLNLAFVGAFDTIPRK